MVTSSQAKLAFFQNNDTNDALDLSKLKNDNIVEELTLTETIMEQSKEPASVAIIYILLAHPIVTTFLSKYIKYISITNEGQITTTGLLIKGFLASIIFYIVKKFLLK